jgi:hypothetical protein
MQLAFCSGAQSHDASYNRYVIRPGMKRNTLAGRAATVVSALLESIE